MTAQGYEYLSPPSAHTVGILLFTRRISTSLSRIAIHKGLSARCGPTRASRTYTILFVSWALCGLTVEFIVFHYMIFALGINTIWFKLDSCLYPPLAKQRLYSSTIPQGCYSKISGPICVRAQQGVRRSKYNYCCRDGFIEQSNHRAATVRLRAQMGLTIVSVTQVPILTQTKFY